jgi:hypothetical protein
MGMRSTAGTCGDAVRDVGRVASRFAVRRGMVSVAIMGVAALAACHGDKKGSAGDSVAVAAPAADTTPQDLSKVQTGLPPAAADTFTPPKAPVAQPDYPPAPPALMQSVTREQAFSKFCFEEFGQKADPSLRGGVAVLVTVSDNAVQDAKVANSRWSAKAAGEQVNQCLNEKARLAWKLGDSTVKPGKYVVQLSFRGE